jgi:hypothetical protein
MKKLVASALIAFAAAAPGLVQAQFSMPSIPGMGKSGASAPAADLSGQQDALVRNFVAANKDVLTANSRMADALGLKSAAAASQSQADQMGSGATEGSIKDANKVVADTDGAIAAELAKKPVLDAAAKAKFGEGLVHLVSGTTKYAGMGKDVTSMVDGIKNASPLQMAKLSSAAYVVSKFPASASDLAKTLKAAMDFAKEQGISQPANAQDALAALGSNK